ncbi:MAG: BlaI/MecI/CopY family transcriptional regulator [Verrucomicrobiia bacterium]
MPKPELPRPTEGELAILRVLWKCGPSTVREVQESLGTDAGYTTVLKLMQIMAAKGLVHRNKTERTHVYAATAPESATQRQLVRHLLDRAFEGSAAKLVMQVLSVKRASPNELAEIRRLLKQFERGSK